MKNKNERPEFESFGTTGDIAHDNANDLVIFIKNKKLLIVYFLITYGMLLWIFFQPGSAIFMGIRLFISWISVVCIYFSFFGKKEAGINLYFLAPLLLYFILLRPQLNHEYLSLAYLIIITAQVSLIFYTRWSRLKITRKMIKTTKEILQNNGN